MKTMARFAQWLFGLILPNTALGTEERIRKIRNKAFRLHREGRFDDAQQAFQQWVALAEKLGTENLHFVRHLDEIADFHQNVGSFEYAETLFRRSLATKERIFGAESLQTATGINNLALLCYAQSKHAEAERLYQRLRSVLEKTAPDTRDLAICLDNYAALLRRLHRERESAGLIEEARKIRQGLKQQETTSVG